MNFNSCFCFFTWCSYRNSEFWNLHKICAITTGIKNYKSIIKKKKKKKNDKTVLLAKTKLNGIKILVSEALTDSHISHFMILVNNVFQEYDDTKE